MDTLEGGLLLPLRDLLWLESGCYVVYFTFLHIVIQIKLINITVIDTLFPHIIPSLVHGSILGVTTDTFCAASVFVEWSNRGRRQEKVMAMLRWL